jgi:aminoglycoside 6'-N-acetyltransferase
VIETNRLILRPFQLSDHADMLEYQSNPEVVRYIPWPIRTSEQVREALEKGLFSTKIEKQGDALLLSIELKESKKVIGQTNLSLVSEKNKYAEFGYVVNPIFSGHGYVTEASRALITWAFANLDLHRIGAVMDQRNPKSRAVCERLGLRLEASHLEDDFFKNEWTSTWIFATLKSEWQLLN